MGEVLVKYRVMPDGPETDLDVLQQAMASALPAEIAKVSACAAVPFAFGMKALVTTVIIQDEEGNSDKVEEMLREVEGVQGLELLEMGRL